MNKRRYALLAYVRGEGKISVPLTPDAQPPRGASTYYLRYTGDDGKRHTDPLGPDFRLALAEARRLDGMQEYERRTGEKFPEKKTACELTPAILGTLKAQIDKWINLKRLTPGMARATCDRYERSMTLFQMFVKYAKEKGIADISSAQKVTRDDAFRFSAYLTGERKFKPRTAFNYFRYLMMFQKAVGCDLKIPAKQWGEPPKRKAQAYKEHELEALFRAASDWEQLLFKAFLYTGMRNKELAHLTYADIDFQNSVWYVQPKDNWEVKSKSAVRGIPVSPVLTEEIRERMVVDGQSETDLVFPNESGGVHNFYLQRLKELSVRAGVKGRVDLHKFRATCATKWMRDGVNVMEVQRLLGHADLKTMKQYIELVDLEDPKIREQNTKNYAKYDNIRR